jgi:hypothetical protein
MTAALDFIGRTLASFAQWLSRPIVATARDAASKWRAKRGASRSRTHRAWRAVLHLSEGGRRYAPLIAVVGLAIATPTASGYEKVTGTFGASCESLPCPAGQFDEPTSVAVNDSTEDVYVVDSGDDRVEWFNATGSKFEGQFDGSGKYEIASKNEKLTGAAPPTGKFLQPGAIAVNNDAASIAHGDVYVADVGHDVVDEFAANGEYEGQIAGGHCEDEEEPLPCSTGVLVPFNGLIEVATNPSGGIWVYEAEHAEVYEFTDAGALEEKFATNEPSLVTGFAVDSSGNVYTVPGDPGETQAPVAEYEKATGARIRRVTPYELIAGTASLAIIGANDDVLVDTGSDIELYRPPLAEQGEPFQKFPSGGLSESPGIAVNGEEGEGTLYATQRTADNVEIFAAGAPEQPQIASAKATSTTSETGQFEVVVKPGDRKTSVTIEYSRDVSTDGKELEGTITTLTGSEVAAEFGEETSTVTGVEFSSASASYYYRVTATNTLGTVRSEVYAYTKLPIIAQENVHEKTSTAALLEATVEPDFIETTYAFEYAETEAALNNGEGIVIHGVTGFLQSNKLEELKRREEQLKKEEEDGLVAPGTVPICPGIAEEGGTGTLPENEAANLKCPVTAEIAGLTPGQKYYYRVVAENRVSKDTENANQGEPILGPIEELKPYAAPAVTTGESASITSTTATLSGEVNPEGAPTTYEFSYISEAGYLHAQEAGATNPYTKGETTKPRQLSASEAIQAVGPVQALDLLPATIYHYALIATNQFGIQSIGEDRTFTTHPPPPPAAAPNPITQTAGVPYLLTVPATSTLVFPANDLPKEEHTNNTGPKPLTPKQKLTKALKACRKDKKKSKRQKCEHAARSKYKVPTKKRHAQK